MKNRNRDEKMIETVFFENIYKRFKKKEVNIHTAHFISIYSIYFI